MIMVAFVYVSVSIPPVSVFRWAFRFDIALEINFLHFTFYIYIEELFPSSSSHTSYIVNGAHLHVGGHIAVSWARCIGDDKTC